jgi:multicomponent Na+:H+ antiporter subunit G
VAELVLIVTGLLLVVGGLFAVVATVGLVRFPDLYTRIHAASKAGTLGSGMMLVALALASGHFDVATRAIAGVAFLLLTAPVAAHLLARAAYVVGFKPWEETRIDELAGARLERPRE